MADQENQITAIEQRTVHFYEDQLLAVKGQDGQIYVSIRHLCDVLGLNQRGQVQRIERTTALNRGYRKGDVETAGGKQNTSLLRADLVPMWLAGLQTSRLADDMRSRIERYQDEAAKVLWEAFQDGRLSTTLDTSFDELLASDSPAAQAYKMARAMMQLAQNQLMLEAKLDSQADRLDDHDKRLEELESTLGNPDRHITPEQASQVSQGVKAVAMKLSKKTGRNEYGGVYGELYRQFGITSYKLLPAKKFEAAMKFLSNWYQEITDEAFPF